MRSFQLQIKKIYEASDKTPAQWMYLANAVMAFGQYHEKWNQIGTDPESYDKWVESRTLLSGLSRLTQLMEKVPRTEHAIDCDNVQGGTFEREMQYKFPSEQCIEGNGVSVAGVQGICDWTGEGLTSPKGEKVDLLEIKFVNELGNINRLQVLVYCALLSIEYDRSCSGILYNARTGELEICSIELKIATEFLLSISQFKMDGTKWQHSPSKMETLAVSNSMSPITSYSKNQISSKKNTDRKMLVKPSVTTSMSITSLRISHGEKRKRLRHSPAKSRVFVSANIANVYDLTMDSRKMGKGDVLSKVANVYDLTMDSRKKGKENIPYSMVKSGISRNRATNTVDLTMDSSDESTK